MKSEKIYNLRAPETYIAREHIEEFTINPYRTEFGRDRDRILYSKAFRRLKGKTQVFLSKGADHLRTRLTHTLEVSQIARTISFNLHLNGLLTEAIALGHDLGHTPFGHVGERTLNQIMNNCDSVGDFQNQMISTDKGFKHNWQGLRVVCELEKLYEKPGLNLTNFTLWGILHHSNVAWKKCNYYVSDSERSCYLLRNPIMCSHSEPKFDLDFYAKYKKQLMVNNGGEAWSFEGYVVAIADEISQRHHDIEDALNMGIIDRKELIDMLEENFKDFYSGTNKFDQINKRLLRKIQSVENNNEFMPYLSKFIVNFYTNQLIETSRKNLSNFIFQNKLQTRKDYIKNYLEIGQDQVANIIGYTNEFQDRDKKLQSFLKNRILNSYDVQKMDGKGRFIIRRLFKAYLTNPRQLRDSTVLAVFKNYGQDISAKDTFDIQKIGFLREQIDSASNKSNTTFQIALLRAVCDNISGMTDDFAIEQYKQLYG